MRKWVVGGLALVAFVVLGLEVLLRVLHVVDVPLYRPDPNYGYIPQANQTGIFLNKNKWSFNEQSMSAAPPFTGSGTLLIGDSIVSGGNQLDDAERLGPRLQALTEEPVWAVCAGSWSILNELAWLRKNPDVVRSVDQIVFVVSSIDFVEPSVWRESPDHPRHAPVSAVAYLIDRLVLAKLRPAPPAPPETGRDWRAELAAFKRSTNQPVLMVLYSAKPNSRPDPVETYEQQLGPNVLMVKQHPRWIEATYRDAEHLDAAGTKLLASVIAERLGRQVAARD